MIRLLSQEHLRAKEDTANNNKEQRTIRKGKDQGVTTCLITVDQ